MAATIAALLCAGFVGHTLAFKSQSQVVVDGKQNEDFSPQGRFLLAALADVDKKELSIAESQFNGYLSGLNQGGFGISDASSVRLKELLGKTAVLATRGQIVSAQLLASDIYRQYPADKSAELVKKFLEEAISPPAHDAAFIEALSVYERMARMLDRSISEPDLKVCALIELKGSMFDDRLAMEYAQSCLSNNEDARLISSSAASEIQKYMELLKSAYSQDSDHE